MKFLLQLIFCLTILLPSLQSQTIDAPIFVCVDNDTLQWVPQPNGCGTFVGYQIYMSTSGSAGPYTLLTTVTTAAQTFYYNPNPTNQTRHYYLLNSYNCAGVTFLSSDTLDNLVPELPIIDYATVVSGNQVTLSWQPSTSPEVIGYIIYRTTLIGLVPIDTIYGLTTYTDPTASADSQPEAYSVLALDGCGSTSIFGTEHKTIYLEATQDSCLRQVTLTWTPYAGWTNTASQEIWMSTTGLPPTLIATLDGNTTTYTITDALLTDLTDYCFTVRARGSSITQIATSNELCLTTNFAIPIREMSLINVDIQNNSVILSWVWNTDADVKYAHAWRQKGDEPYDTLLNYVPSVPLQDTGRFVINGSNFKRGALNFYLEGSSVCDSITFSNKASAIILIGRPLLGNLNILDWSDYFNEIGTIQSYQLYKDIDGSWAPLQTFTPTDSTQYLDPVSSTEFESCYLVAALATVTLADGTQQTVRTRSN